MPCNDCSRTEKCPPCPHEEQEKPECEHPNKYNYGFASGPPGIRYFYCPDCKAKWEEEEPEKPSPVDCAHVGSRVIERSDAPEHWTRYLCDDCGARWIRNWSDGGERSEEPPEPRCPGCGHPEHCGFCRELEMPGPPGDVDECGCLDDREPPLTPEEEEEAPEDTHDWHHASPEAGLTCTRCGLAHKNWSGSECPAMQAEAPPQPDRRPPYLLAYSVQGHLYEVALPGDATVAALDGRLVITHSLGPVAGICQIAPITNEESTR